jgi:imidazolonepropionase-like amidohydrolase
MRRRFGNVDRTPTGARGPYRCESCSFLWSATAAAISTSHAGTAWADGPAATLFVNVNVFDGKGSTIHKDVSVLVEGNAIAAIAKGRMKAPQGATVIDGGGRTLMPGLIDNHVHIFMTGSSQARMLDPNTTFEQLEATASDVASKMLLRGITSVRDVGGPVFGVKRMIDQGKHIGPRIYPSGATASYSSSVSLPRTGICIYVEEILSGK